MPTYDYECDACQHRFELFQSITAAPVKKCPQCGKSKARRLIGTGAGIIFKGSGFYCTDYRSKTYSEAAKKDSASSTSSTSASSTTTSTATPSASSESGKGNGSSKASSKSDGNGKK